jgi:hypothetical protein
MDIAERVVGEGQDEGDDEGDGFTTKLAQGQQNDEIFGSGYVHPASDSPTGDCA